LVTVAIWKPCLQSEIESAGSRLSLCVRDFFDRISGLTGLEGDRKFDVTASEIFAIVFGSQWANLNHQRVLASPWWEAADSQFWRVSLYPSREKP
jgi:hypothetical protein